MIAMMAGSADSFDGSRSLARSCVCSLLLGSSSIERVGTAKGREPTVLRLASELYPGVSGGFLGKVWLACLLQKDFKIFPAMPSTN